MRIPAYPNNAYSYDASGASPTASWTPGGHAGLEHQGQQYYHLDERRRALMRALDELSVAGGPPPAAESSWNFTSIPAHTEPMEDEGTQLERDLAAELARAMHHRPLMNRLARVEAAYSELPGSLDAPTTTATPPPIPPTDTSSHSASAAADASSKPIEQLMEEFGEQYDGSPPSSAAWLGKAQRQRNRNRLHTVAAWFATIAIGGSIIATTLLMLYR